MNPEVMKTASITQQPRPPSSATSLVPTSLPSNNHLIASAPVPVEMVPSQLLHPASVPSQVVKRAGNETEDDVRRPVIKLRNVPSNVPKHTSSGGSVANGERTMKSSVTPLAELLDCKKPISRHEETRPVESAVYVRSLFPRRQPLEPSSGPSITITSTALPASICSSALRYASNRSR